MGNQNKLRANWAELTIKHFVDTVGIEFDSHDEKVSALSDLLIDIMHFCRREHINFNRVAMRAEKYYREEVIDDE